MAELSHKERLQPSLLDRLVDEEPGQNNEALNRRVLSRAQLRESVRRDLAYLLNTTRLAAQRDLSAYPEVESSVLNFGIPELSGQTGTGVDIPSLTQQLKKSILNFEPRILPNTVRVNLVVDTEDMGPNALSFLIEGDLWCQPLPLKLYLRTDLDLETGVVEVEEVEGGD